MVVTLRVATVLLALGLSNVALAQQRPSVDAGG